jgi:outer membrane protein TolC
VRITALLLAVVLGGGLAGGRAAAQAPAAPAGVRELSMDEALAMARRNNNNVIAERAKLAQAQTNVTQAWASLLPTIAAQGKYTRNYTKFEFVLPAGPLLIQPVNQLDGVISFAAPLIVPAAYPGLEAVQAGVRSQEESYQATEDSLLFSVAQAFYAAGIAEDVLAARHSSIEVARVTLDNAKTRFAAGTVTKVDVDRAELAFVRAEQLEREAQNGRDQAYRALATLIGMDQPFHVTAPAFVPSPIPDQGLDTVLKLRPEFRAFEQSMVAADKQRQTDALRWSPSVSAFGNARKFNYDNFNRQRYSWAVGVQLDWVIFDGGARDALRKQAAEQEKEIAARSAALTASIRDDLANGRSQLDTKQHALDAATRSVTLARETIDLVRTQYEAGAVTQVDLLQAQDNLVAAEEALAQAHFDVAVADLTLRRAAGTFPPK